MNIAHITSLLNILDIYISDYSCIAETV